MSSRLLTVRSAARALRQPVPRQLVRYAGRKGYASKAPSKTVQNLAQSSEMPWLVGSVSVTAVGLYFLLPRGSHKTETHSHPAPKDEHVEGAPNEQEQKEKSDTDAKPAPKEEEQENKDAQQPSQTGQGLPPAPSDNTSLAENPEEKKERHEEYKDTVKEHDTQVATSSSDMPSKRTEAEHPREDPHKGKDGEAKQKEGSGEGEK